MGKIIVAVKGVLIKNNKMLIVQRSLFDETGAGTWESIGGKLEFGESFEDALKREFLEEVGLNIFVIRQLFSTTFLTHATRQVVLLTFLCDCKNTNITLSDEHEAYKWASKSELLELLPKPIIDDYKKYHILDLLED